MKEKVLTTNQFAFYLMVFHIFYLVVSIIKAPTLLQWPLLGILANLSVLALNYLRLFNLSRIIVCTVPMSVVIIYNSYLTPFEAVPRMTGYLIAMVHTIIPFLVFDNKEKIAQWSLFVILCFSILGMFPLSDLLIDPFLDYDLNYAPKSKRGLIMGLVGLGILLYLMQLEQLRYRNESEKLNRERVERNISLEKSEKELKEALTQVQKTKKEDQERSWTTQNISDFNDLTRSIENLDELIDHSASFLARVLNLNQVAVFTRKVDAEGDDYLGKQTVYAYDRKKYLDKTRIEKGEGLIGQCYIEKKPIVLENVPVGYVNISSGLGDATASFVAIYPLLAYDKVEGVIEVAGFNKLKKFELDFLKRISESLAITILNKIGAERLKELLKTSQEQAEQVRSQEEEMRQNLEEMMATQEELKRQKEGYVKEIERLKMLLNS